MPHSFKIKFYCQQGHTSNHSYVLLLYFFIFSFLLLFFFFLVLGTMHCLVIYGMNTVSTATKSLIVGQPVASLVRYMINIASKALIVLFVGQ